MNIVGNRAPVALALGAAVVIAACGGGNSAEPPAVPAVTANPVDPAKAGRVTGAIRLEGTPPAAEAIRMDSDPYCVREGQKVTQTYVTGTGGTLQNVFVYVKDGLGNLQFPVPAGAVVLDQKGCMYEPHVLGIQVGQTLEILSSDNTLHNVHAMPAQNREFNKAHQMAGLKHTHVFSTKEVMVPFKCDVHKWMNAYVGVLDHPFYAVSGANGSFELKGLPAGTYTIEAWHEALGTQTQTVTIGEQETREITFTFRAA
jgi:plastocyanin